MELHAKKQNAVPEARRQTSRRGARRSIAVRYDALLYDTIQNMIASAHTAGDFTYKSPADYVRTALRAYKNGMKLSELDRNGEKVATSLRVDQDLWEFWRDLPDQLRSRLLERAIRTYMRQRA
jgi:hypothetical protein